MFSSISRKNSDYGKVDVVDDVISTAASKTSGFSSKFGDSINLPQSTVLSEDVEFKGTLASSNKLELHGRFEGEIIANGPLEVGEKGIIKGDVHGSSSIIIRGKVKGNVHAKEKVELGPTAHLYGDIRSPKFVISEGAVFVGRVDTLEGGTKPVEDFTNLFKRLGATPTTSKPASSSSEKKD
ncbi:MAG: polymer-forming cytoskeletal protein [bacterium]